MLFTNYYYFTHFAPTPFMSSGKTKCDPKQSPEDRDWLPLQGRLNSKTGSLLLRSVLGAVLLEPLQP